MLLPTRGISADRALLTVGADVLDVLVDSMTVSDVWDAYRRKKNALQTIVPSFDWFSLALAGLFAMGVIELTDNNEIRRAHVSS